MPPTPSTPQPKQQQPIGPLVGIFIVIFLLIVGALYFWGERLNREAETPTYIPGDAAQTNQ